MKICWDNLEKITKITKNGNFKIKTATYVYMDACKKCNEPYLTRSSIKGDYCSNNCAAKNKNIKHGYFGKPTYRSWHSMKQRCLNQNSKDYKHYGDKGIMVCDRWMKFENFLADMGEKPEGLTLDRIDNDGHYEPSNCRWATRKEQNRNRSFLDEKKVKKIKWLLEVGKHTQKQIAEMFDTSRENISYIKNNKTWSNI